jgi:hypothetical protein
LEYAKQEFKLSERQKDGKTLRDHLKIVQEVTGKTPKELENSVELPKAIEECWYWFLQLNNTRPSGFGISAITFTEMYSFFELHQIDPEISEVQMIKMFDSIALEQARVDQEKQNNQAKTRSK